VHVENKGDVKIGLALAHERKKFRVRESWTIHFAAVLKDSNCLKQVPRANEVFMRGSIFITHLLDESNFGKRHSQNLGANALAQGDDP
jgi:hypothetical protein